MVLSIGRTTDDKRSLNKNFNIVKNVNAELKENTNVINPVFIVSTDNFFKINYLYCSCYLMPLCPKPPLPLSVSFVISSTFSNVTNLPLYTGIKTA